MTHLPQGVPPDSVRAVLRHVFDAPSYEWSARRNPLAYVLAAWRWILDALQRLADRHPLGYLAVMLVLTLVAVLLLTHIGFVLRRALRPPPREAESPAGPLPAVRDAGWHLAEAARLAGAGRYTEALGHRFVALLLQLEARRAVSVRAFKTPAEYVREARLDPSSRGVFGQLVTTLYGAVFGGRACDAAAFADFDRTAAELVHRAQTL